MSTYKRYSLKFCFLTCTIQLRLLGRSISFPNGFDGAVLYLPLDIKVGRVGEPLFNCVNKKLVYRSFLVSIAIQRSHKMRETSAHQKNKKILP